IEAPKGNTDFRTDYPRLTHTPYQLPAVLEQACINLVALLGLHYGAIDIIREKSGEYYFLEINPAGQYHWIEYYTGLPITKAIVDALISAGGSYEY
ncbi:MAG: hypothetical protein J2P36_26600, partial [Ktedonobacteraceae bacterium]|nr:hypothetical protein [Ktedonobacteraceae bacterium]